jgi:hypothetical protein
MQASPEILAPSLHRLCSFTTLFPERPTPHRTFAFCVILKRQQWRGVRLFFIYGKKGLKIARAVAFAQQPFMVLGFSSIRSGK